MHACIHSDAHASAYVPMHTLHINLCFDLYMHPGFHMDACVNQSIQSHHAQPVHALIDISTHIPMYEFIQSYATCLLVRMILQLLQMFTHLRLAVQLPIDHS